MPMLRPPARRARRRSRVYKKKTMYKKKRKSYKKKRQDKGTFLKVTSGSIPLLFDNNFAGQPPIPGILQTPDTFQTGLQFQIGGENPTGSISLTDAFYQGRPLNNTTVQMGLDDANFSSYADLYKYMQIYKISVKYTPTITRGGVIAIAGASGASGAIGGTMTTDINRDASTLENFEEYWENFPPDLAGQSKSMSRKVSRSTTMYKGWTRTFKPSNKLLQFEGQGQGSFNTDVFAVQNNPKDKYQYQPKIDLNLVGSAGTALGTQRMVIRMRKPQYSGFPATSVDALDVDFPPNNNYCRAGTITCTAYVKFSQPYN